MEHVWDELKRRLQQRPHPPQTVRDLQGVAAGHPTGVTEAPCPGLEARMLSQIRGGLTLICFNIRTTESHFLR